MSDEMLARLREAARVVVYDSPKRPARFGLTPEQVQRGLERLIAGLRQHGFYSVRLKNEVTANFLAGVRDA